MQVEDREDENEKQQQKIEESRKRKRGVNKARAKQARNFISEKTAGLMEGSLKDRGFIAERRFKQVISPFAEMLEREDGSHWVNTKNLVMLL